MLEAIGEKFSFMGSRFSEDYLLKMREELIRSRLDIDEKVYLSVCAGISVSFGVLSFMLILMSPVYAAIPFMVVGTSFILLSKYPTLRKKSVAMRLERELVNGLPYFALQMRVKQPFEKCMEKMASQNTLIAEDFRKALSEMKNGKSAKSALQSICDRTDSKRVSRMVGAVITAYSNGDAEMLKKVVDEQRGLYHIRVRQYNARVVLYSLGFVGIGAVAPSLFQAIYSLGSVFMDLSISPLAAFLTIVVFFPSINALLLWWMVWSKP